MRIPAFISLLAAIAANGNEQTESPMLATADAAIAQIIPLAEGRDFVLLPALEFGFTLQPQCPENSRLAAMSVSVADTHVNLATADLENEGFVEAALTLPRQQTGPVRVGVFCSADEVGGNPRLLIEDIFTARISLRCSAGESQSITYATLPLDVILACNREDDQGP